MQNQVIYWQCHPVGTDIYSKSPLTTKMWVTYFVCVCVCVSPTEFSIAMFPCWALNPGYFNENQESYLLEQVGEQLSFPYMQLIG